MIIPLPIHVRLILLKKKETPQVLNFSRKKISFITITKHIPITVKATSDYASNLVEWLVIY
jgi:predicted ATP-grasp superfamily ATP-dependent carboligase